MNQNQARHKISNSTSSWNSKLGEILISVVKFHLVHFYVQVATWWWYKCSFDLTGTTGICIDFWCSVQWCHSWLLWDISTGPSENWQSGGGNVGFQDISAHFSPVTESVLMYDHFLVTLAIWLYLFSLLTYHPIRKINFRVINYCCYQVNHKWTKIRQDTRYQIQLHQEIQSLVRF